MKNLTKAKSKLVLSLLGALATTVISSQSAYAADLTAESNNPKVIFNDIETGESTDWELIGGSSDTNVGSFVLKDLMASNNHNVINIFGTQFSTNNLNSLVVDSAGDVNLADGSVFIDKSGNKLGIGTTTPVTQIEIVTDGFSIISDIGLKTGQGPRFEIEATTGHIGINEENGFNIFRIYSGASQSTLNIGSPAGGSNIGIGTTSAESALHIKKAGAVLTVEDTTAGGVSNVIKLKRPGSVGFSMENTTLGQAWDFRTASNGGFLVSNIGVAGAKFQINLDGRVFMAGGKFDLKPDGTMTLAGNSNALLHVDTSSREAKTDFEKINAKDVMDKIKAIEVSEWRYKDSAAQGRHIGPMAEDFYSLFKLGADNKHIAALDMASIALIAAKELQKKSDTVNSVTAALKSKTSELELENRALKARLASLEKLVTNLALGQGLLPEKGDKVVLK